MSRGSHLWPFGRGDVRAEVTPIATPNGARLGIEVTHAGARALRHAVVDVRPAPPGIRGDRVPSVVAPSAAARGRLTERLAPGESCRIELACPLQPGPLYRRVLALDPDDDEPVYGLPIETLLWIEVRWHERGALGLWRHRRRRLVRGAYRDTQGR